MVKNPDKQENWTTVTSQSGVFRVNCLDCLDRTNIVQSCIAKDLVTHFISKQYPGKDVFSEFVPLFNSLWADNGDWISII